MHFEDSPQIEIIHALARRAKRRVFLVGGCVRDFYLQRPCTDFDFAVDRGAIALARSFSRRIKGAFVLLDQEHGSARVVKKNCQGVPETFDFTDWRGKTMAADLKRRDFTVNAMAVDIQWTGKVLGAAVGQKDLKAKTIRMVSRRAFSDDPLRLLRAYALQATLGFKIDAKTLVQIKKEAALVTTPAMERVREELFKVLLSPRTCAVLKAMDSAGILAKIIPHLTVMRKVKQGGYHHLDVWRHSLEVLHQFEIISQDLRKDPLIAVYLQQDIGGGHGRYALLKLAALLHDIGKPETRRQEKDRMTFHGHEHAGERITRLVAKHLKLSVKERHFLEDMVRLHLRPGYLSNFKRPSDKAVFRYLRDTKQEAAGLAMLALADQAATRGPLTTVAKHKHHAAICHMLIQRYFAVKQEKPKQRLLTGHDLIQLKLKPSPLFAKILAAVEEATALGRIHTKAEALVLARKLADA